LHKTRRQRYEDSRPFLLNHLNYSLQDLNRLDINITTDINVHIVDLLHNFSGSTTITTINPSDSRILIESIECPICHQPVPIDKHWDCFICTCQNQKKIYDIISLSSPKLTEHECSLSILFQSEIKKLRETEDGDPDRIYNLQRGVM